MNIKNKIRNSLFANSLRLVTRYKNSLFLTIVFTIAFILAIFFFRLFNLISLSWITFPFMALAVFLLIYYFKIGLIFLFDALFIVSFFILKKFFDSFADQFPLPTTSGAFYTFLGFSLAYYLIALL